MKLPKLLHTFIFLLFSGLLPAQSLDALSQLADSLSTVDYARSVEVYQQILEKAQQENNPIAIVRTYNQLSDASYKNGVLHEMIKYAEKGAAAIETYNIPTDSSVVQLNLLEFGTYYTEKSDYTKAAEYQKRALDFFLAQSPRDSSKILVAANNLAVTYKRKEDFEKAANYYTVAERHIDATARKNNHINLAIIYSNIGQAYSESRQYDKAAYYFKKSFPVFDKNPDNPYTPYVLPSTYNNIALLYSAAEQYDSALFYLKKSSQLHLNEVQQLVLLNSRGYVCGKLGKYDAALQDLKASLTLREKRYAANSAQVAVTRNHIGDIYFAKGEYDNAMTYYQQALSSLLYDFDSDDINQPIALTAVVSSKHLLNTLQNKGKTFFAHYRQDYNQDFLLQSLYNYQQAIALIQTIRQGYRSEGSKQFLNEKTAPIFEETMEVLATLYHQSADERYAEMMLQVAEKSKAVLLLEGLKETEALKFADIPKDLLDQERQLKLDILFYEKKLYAAKKEEDKKNYTDLLIQAKEAYDDFVAALEQDFPDYYHLKYDNSAITIQEVRNDILLDNHVMIEYFVGKSTIYTIAISRDKVSIHKELMAENFIDELLAFRKSLTDLSYIQKNLKEVYSYYETAGFDWYKYLLEQPLAEHTATEIIIIPDGLLSYLPYEALLYETPQNSKSFRTLPYLILRYNVQYAYSASLLQQLKQADRTTPKYNYGGFAAAYKTTNEAVSYAIRSGATPLPNATKEVQEIANIMNGKASLGATEGDFKAKANRYNILHFAMHGILDDENPLLSHLLFSTTDHQEDDDKLTALEIYNMNFNAELAVLSACNTGYGTLRKGEGVMSLSRAFTYAGTPSMVMSLWSVPDASSSEIIIDFFKKIATEKAVLKSQALREAKLNYLEDKDAFLSHPIFWAGFTPIGDMSPVAVTSSNIKIWYIFIVAFVVLLGVLWLRKRKKSH